MAKITVRPKPGTPSTKPGKPDRGPSTKPGKPSTSPGEPGPRPRPPGPGESFPRPKIGVKWWDDLVGAVLDGFFGADEAGDLIGETSPEEQADVIKRWREAKGTNPRKGVLKFSDAMEIVEKHILNLPGMLLSVELIEADMRPARLPQTARRAWKEGIQRRLGGAGWKGPRTKRPAPPNRTDDQQSAYRAEHRSRTGYGRGRPKNDDKRREYPPKKPRGRPPIGNA